MTCLANAGPGISRFLEDVEAPKRLLRTLLAAASPVRLTGVRPMGRSSAVAGPLRIADGSAAGLAPAEVEPARAVTGWSAPAASTGPKSACTASGLSNRELGSLPRGRLSLGSRQRRPDQRTMHRTLDVAAAVLRAWRIGCQGWRLWCVWGGSIDGDWVRRVGECLRGNGRLRRFAGHPGENLLVEHARRRLLFPLRWHLCLLVLVFGVAGRAPGLFHVLSHHGDDGVVGDTSLAWTVVVDDVAKPKLTLLHQPSRRE
jgi:hypothetical protein